jgi:hypothetical protein
VSDAHQPPLAKLERPPVLLLPERARRLRAEGLTHQGHLLGAGLLWRSGAFVLVGTISLLTL